MALIVVPSIDLRGGRVVRLKQGDYGRQMTYDVDPFDVARSFATAGAKWMHIVDLDGVSASGQEIYNFCKQEGITNIALMGVHTNICILNRSFGIRQMTKTGFQVALVRDLTDAMYDPRKRPFVSHARGTELIIEHIETRWCPSILSSDLTRIIPGTDRPSSLSLRSHSGI